jgi:hypothetical protein
MQKVATPPFGRKSVYDAALSGLEPNGKNALAY